MPITNKRQEKFPFLCDMHSHILPHMDDGCKSINETYKNILKSEAQGVRLICATPHFGNELSLDDFLEKRSLALLYTKRLINGCFENVFIIPGAEIAYYDGITTEDRIKHLCYGNSRYMLIEMPFGPWDARVLNDINLLQNSYGYTVVIAHLERYLEMQKRSTISDLLDTGALIQMNAGYILNRKTEKRAIKMIEDGHVHLIGSDCHSPNTRPQNVGLAFDKLYEKGMHKAIRRIMGIEIDICKAATDY